MTSFLFDQNTAAPVMMPLLFFQVYWIIGKRTAEKFKATSFTSLTRISERLLHLFCIVLLIYCLFLLMFPCTVYPHCVVSPPIFPVLLLLLPPSLSLCLLFLSFCSTFLFLPRSLPLSPSLPTYVSLPAERGGGWRPMVFKRIGDGGKGELVAPLHSVFATASR